MEAIIEMPKIITTTAQPSPMKVLMSQGTERNDRSPPGTFGFIRIKKCEYAIHPVIPTRIMITIVSAEE